MIMQSHCNIPALGQLVGVGVTVTVTVVVIVMNSGDAVSTHKTSKISLSADALNNGYRNLHVENTEKEVFNGQNVTYPCLYFAKCVLEKDKEKGLLLSFQQQMFAMQK